MKKLIITEEERSRILGMHQSATARQYLMEDQTQLNKVQSYINSTVQEMNKLISDTAKQQQKTLPTIKIKNSPKEQTVTATDGTTTKVTIDNYYFELEGAKQGSSAPINIDLNNVTDPSRYGIFQKSWIGSLSNQNWLMNIDRSLVAGLQSISKKYLDSSMQLLGNKPSVQPQKP